MVRNEIPTYPRHPKVAFIGECPGRQEEQEGRPFVGPSGNLLWHSCDEVRLSRMDVFVGNVCQHRAPGDDIHKLRWDHPHIQEGIATLREDLRIFDPDFVVCLGGTPLRAVTGEKLSIESHKGTLFLSDVLTPRKVKHLAMFHPAAVLRNDGYLFFWRHQLNRLEEEMQVMDLTLPHRDIFLHTSLEDALGAMHSLHGRRLAWDIEGYARSGVTCMSFSPSPWEAHVIPFSGGGKSLHPREHEEKIWNGFRALLDSFHLYEPYHQPTQAYITKLQASQNEANLSSCCLSAIPANGLITWNGLYDSFVLAYRHGINPVHAIVDDGMLLHWELFSEVDKGLADATSWLTREPFYKSERKSDTPEVQWRYNGKDTCVTFECTENLLKREECTQSALDHYRFNLSLLPPILYMELRGIRFDDDARLRLLRKMERQACALQGVMNRLVGMPFPTNGGEFKDLVVSTMCQKRPRIHTTIKKVLQSGPRKGQEVEKTISTPAIIGDMHDACRYALSPHAEALHTLRQLCWGDWNQVTTLGALKRARAATLLGLHFNTQSPAANEYLYNTLLLPPQYKKEQGRLTDRLTHDQDALLTLYMKSRKDPKYKDAEKPLRVWLLLSSTLTAIETLVKSPDYDGRMRCSYNHVGSKTGRFSCSESAVGVGYNLQTVTASHRHMFLADNGYTMGQFDLKGADGWTVACNCAAHGDNTMLEDFAASIKPAQAVVLLMLQGDSVNAMSREELKEACKKLPKDWRYKAAKRIIWGTCYLMGIVTMGEQITQDAYKENNEFLVVTAKDCKDVQAATLKRYWGVAKWQDEVKRHVMNGAAVEGASGHVRRFYGRRWEYKEDPTTGNKYLTINRTVWGDALSDCPQENTTFATKLALWRLWYDQENRMEGLPGKVLGFPCLRVEPLHTVHDSLVDQWRDEDLDFARRKHVEWFNNPLTIANRTITIPVDGEYSKDWGMMDAQKI